MKLLDFCKKKKVHLPLAAQARIKKNENYKIKNEQNYMQGDALPHFTSG